MGVFSSCHPFLRPAAGVTYVSGSIGPGWSATFESRAEGGGSKVKKEELSSVLLLGGWAPLAGPIATVD